MFQDFVLEFNKIKFTNGRRKLLLFIVLKTEGTIFQELREYDRAIRAYKSLKNFCDIWNLKYPGMKVCEQLGFCYRAMRMHAVAVDFFGVTCAAEAVPFDSARAAASAFHWTSAAASRPPTTCTAATANNSLRRCP